MAAPRHLVTVWNPAYAATAMDAHLEVLLRAADRPAGPTAADSEAEPPYVWWAKLRSENRQQPLPHTADVLALQAQIDRGEETHLYLTDYRSLYVGLLEEITADDLLAEHPGEVDQMPGYYVDRPVDFWFRLADVRLLVADDTVTVIEELRHLRNVRYGDRPVSLYGGMVELPLVVTRGDGRRWFADRDAFTDGRLWARRDAEHRGALEEMGRELRENLLGEEVWAALELTTRSFLGAAEAVFRAHREDPGFDFSGAAVSYAKAVEAELNALVFGLAGRELRTARPADREVWVDGRRLDLGGAVPHQTLGTLKGLLERDDTVREVMKRRLPHDAAWVLGELPHGLARVMELRNPAAHSETTTFGRVAPRRAEILGIGREGLLVRLARVKMRSAA
jgi:hypothetical protein